MRVERIGRYQVRHVLGRGGAAIVFLAHDPVIDREVALKVLRGDLVEEDAEEFRRRFLREARAAGRLSHPNIVTVFDVGEDEEQDLLFIAMEYVQGRTLKDFVDTGERLEAARVVELTSRLAEALDYAHSNGVVHRDVKPANIVITRDGDVKITDFGVARVDAAHLTKDGHTSGTPYYMSPEQIRGAPVDGRSDIYSLGLIMFELLVGKRPFIASSLPELSLKIVQESPPDLASLRPDLPRTLISTTMRCLEKRPEDRFQSGHDLAVALREIVFVSEDVPTAEEIGIEGAASAPVDQGPPPLPITDERELLRTLPSQTQALDDFGHPVDAAAQPRARGLWRRVSLLALAAGAALLVVMVAALIIDRDDLPPSAASTQQVEELREAKERLDSATESLDRGELDTAIDAASEVLEEHPSSRAAEEILAEARRLQRMAAAAARISVDFVSPLGRGRLELILDGDPLEHISWDFSRKIVLGITRKGKGVVKGQVQVRPGRHELKVRLLSDSDTTVGEAAFEEDFAPDSRWLLTVDMPKRKSEPSFKLRLSEGDEG
jgi:serine/threonine-protein kinase